MWKGQNLDTKKLVAAKLVEKRTLANEKLKSLFITEVKYMGLINNENVVKLLEYLESPNTCYVIMYYNKKIFIYIIKIKNY